MQNLLEPLKEGRVRLLLNAGDHLHMHTSLKQCLEKMGVDFKVNLITLEGCLSVRVFTRVPCKTGITHYGANSTSLECSCPVVG